MVVVWFKRDLRLLDHEPLVNAIASGQKILLLYVFEPLWTQDPHYGNMHLTFIQQSLADLQNQLLPYHTKILVLEGEICGIFQKLSDIEPITHVFSHQETGMKITFDRDKRVHKWCNSQNIPWTQSVCNGVFRGRRNRKNWMQDWLAFTNAELQNPKMENGNFISLSALTTLLEDPFETPNTKVVPQANLQKGGTTTAVKYLQSFFKERVYGYTKNYSKPATSRIHSSRLSPYLAWGNLSSRQVFRFAAQQKNTVPKRELNAFLSRLRWQAHFIQKFEMEWDMEFQSVNKGYHQLSKPIRPDWQKAWREGQTGVPMVDAAMRCLVSTGFVNFRLRALLASFFTHLLWQPWQDCTAHLATHFLDFEPGIHFPQLNMQSGETGINTIRIYNPVKNGKDHDPEGKFIKKWVPELSEVPVPYLHEPWTMPPLEQQFCHFVLGETYPFPIIPLESARKFATEMLWNYKKTEK